MAISSEKQDVKEVFDEYGQTVTLVSQTKGVFNANTGEYNGVIVSKHSMKGIVSKQVNRNAPKGLVDIADKTVFIYADDTYSPVITDRLVLTTGGKEFSIKRVDEYKLRDEVIAFSLLIDR